MDERAKAATRAAAMEALELERTDMLREYRSKQIARERRWSYTGKSCVEHPKYGSVIVPHGSNLSALMNAAEYWGCDVSELTDKARVWECDQSLPAVSQPKISIDDESWMQMIERTSREHDEKEKAKAAAKVARQEEKKKKEATKRAVEDQQISFFGT